MSEDKISQGHSWPAPRNQIELRSLHGLARYYMRFMREFVKIADPLHKLTEKSAKSPLFGP